MQVKKYANFHENTNKYSQKCKKVLHNMHYGRIIMHVDTRKLLVYIIKGRESRAERTEMLIGKDLL